MPSCILAFFSDPIVISILLSLLSCGLAAHGLRALLMAEGQSAGIPARSYASFDF